MSQEAARPAVLDESATRRRHAENDSLTGIYR
jgi:hypothetical protein